MGLVDSLARPGGNVTGVAMVFAGLSAKRVEKFREAAPDLSRIAVLWNPLVLDKGVVDLAETRSACLALGIEQQPFEVRAASDLKGALQGLAQWRANGIITLLDAFTGSYQPQIISFAMDNRLPTICEGRGFVMRGGFMSYGPDPFAMFARAAGYVDRILKGSNPASLPVEQPTHVEVVVNLQTANGIGRTIPREVLLEADQVIT
jgi:putative ABC transport system substrate-binding protein